ncbi:hypothetical protein Tco_1141749, partial [Tanacetum coccineum]
RFETYIKSTDIDLWQVIQNSDFYFEIKDSETKMMKETLYELLKEDQKKQLGKNNEARMTLYNALPYKDKAYIMLNKEIIRIKESLNVTFDESLPEPKSSPLVEDDRIIEPIVQYPVRSPSLEVNVSEPSYPKSIKEARGHPI